jgi:hypothetical protein
MLKEGQRVTLLVKRELPPDKSLYPPPATRPAMPGDLRGFSSAEELLAQLSGSAAPPFPFAHELALYLLLIASIWPNNPARLLTAARLFSAALNFHDSTVNKKHVVRMLDRYIAVGRVISHRSVVDFNRAFFDRIGGAQSILFTQSADDFHSELWKSLKGLDMVHDVIEYILKASALSPRLSSVTFAFEAIAENIFQRKGGYGVQRIRKDRAPDRPIPAGGTTVQTVRTAFRRAPADTIVLSYVLARRYGLCIFDLADPRLFLHLAVIVEDPTTITKTISIHAHQLLKGKVKQSTTLALWAKNAGPSVSGTLLYQPLSDQELDRAFAIAARVLSKPLVSAEQHAIRSRQKNWLKQTPDT